MQSMAARTAAVELMGIGDWPATDGTEDTIISPEEWAEIEEHEWEFVDPVVVAFDISPDRRTSIVVAGRTDRGHMGVELIHNRAGTGWVAERMVELYRAHEIAEVVCDGYGPSAAIAQYIDEAGITVKRMDSADYGKACGLFVDSVGEKTLRHLGQEEMSQAIRGAKAAPARRSLGVVANQVDRRHLAAGGGDAGAVVGSRERRRRGGDLLDGRNEFLA